MTTSQQPEAPKPMAPKPGSVAPAQQPTVAPVQPTPAYSSNLEEAQQFAEISDEGVVTLLDGAERIEVGQIPEATPQEALSYYVRKYDDVMTQIQLLEQRLTTDASNQELEITLEQLDKTIEQRQMVGNIDKLRERSAKLHEELIERQAKQKAARDEAISIQKAAREKIVARAEEVAAQDSGKTQWKQSTTTMRELFDQWRDTQKAGPRLPRTIEDELWKRFRSARNTFEKNRRAFFSQLDEQNAEAKRIKEKLIERAEALQHSTEWGPTTLKYRDLMNEWKKSPRASRKDDDALWNRFRGAQDIFFKARDSANAELDLEYSENLTAKEKLLQDAEKHLPFKDLEKARRVVKDLTAQWENFGRVPRKDISRMEAGIAKFERALSDLEQEHWRKSDPETKARTNSALSQLEDSIAQLERELQIAQEADDSQKIAKAQEALEARRQWLAVVQAAGE